MNTLNTRSIPKKFKKVGKVKLNAVPVVVDEQLVVAVVVVVVVVAPK